MVHYYVQHADAAFIAFCDTMQCTTYMCETTNICPDHDVLAYSLRRVLERVV